ncbi:MAG: complex I NDUFA9 subunit family protein [Alphaproteobacteria bacterium]
MDVVTVFGGSGFIGRYVIRELAGSGARIRAAVRRPDGAGFLRTMGDVGQVTPIAANVRDDASVAAAVDGADTVINLVGILYEAGKQNFGAVQADGARRVAQAAKTAGASRLIQMSAIGADPNADSVYASTKGGGEALVRDAFPGATVVRPSVVFGPEDDFFNKFAMIARLAPALPLVGGGHTKFQPVYVGDVADAISALARGDGEAGATYELGGPQVYSFRELMEIVLDAIGRKRCLVPVPFPVAQAGAAVTDWAYKYPLSVVRNFLPTPLLTQDQVRLLRHDNVVSGGCAGLKDLGIEATSVEALVPTYLNRYRKGVWHT